MKWKLIAGLGNPGPAYHYTRHNLGYQVIDHVLQRLGRPAPYRAFSSELFRAGASLLIKPQTFMNLSGRALAPAVSFYGVDPRALLVIHDELDLPFGKIKVKFGGGAGGHNGLRSMIGELGHGDFYRLRVGIGKPADRETVGYVLSGFSEAESALMKILLDFCAECVITFMEFDAVRCMNQFSNRAAFKLKPKEDL